MKKLMELKVQAKAFLAADDKESVTEALKSLFGIDEMEEEVTLTLNLEEFLWAILQKIPVPVTPLKIALHKKVLEEAAVVLSQSQTIPDMLPSLSDDLLEQIKPYINDDEKFEQLHDIPFLAINKKDAAQSRVLPLPAKNIVRDLDFVTTIAELFERKLV
jgi:hypothetical protein